MNGCIHFCLDQGHSSSPVKPQIPQQPQNSENEPRPKYQQNNVNAVPKAIPVR